VSHRVEVTIELTTPWQKREITEADIPWARLLEIAKSHYKSWEDCRKRLVKARKQERMSGKESMSYLKRR